MTTTEIRQLVSEAHGVLANVLAGLSERNEDGEMIDDVNYARSLLSVADHAMCRDLRETAEFAELLGGE